MNVSALLGVASAAPTPLQPFAAAGSAIFGAAESIFGGGGDTDNARAAKQAAYLKGGLAGDVMSIRLLLGNANAGAKAERQMNEATEATLQQRQPLLYNQAVQLGAVVDHEDNQLGLAELLKNRIQFSAPGAGHPTGHGHYGHTDPTTMQIVQELAALPLTPSGMPPMTVAANYAGTVRPAGSAPPTPGLLASSATAPLQAATPMWLVLGLVGALAFVAFMPHRAGT